MADARAVEGNPIAFLTLFVMVMKTIFVKEKDQEHKWFLIDATGLTLGRVAAEAAAIARGKRKVTYTPNQEMGDYVVIINADKVAVSGGKEQKKIYYKYTTGYVGSLKAHTFEKLLEKHSTQPLEIAIRGMLPHNRLGRRIFENIKIYATSDHPHKAQNPIAIKVGE